jgi:hypothetical protein
MRLMFLLLAFGIISCGQKSSKETVTANGDTTVRSVESDKTEPVNENSVPVVLTDDAKINEALNSQAGNKWRVVTDKETTWETQKDKDNFLLEGRKKDPNHPFIVKGDFNGDGQVDMAALVTNGANEDNRLKTQIAIIHGDGTIKLMDEYSTTNSALELVNKMTKIDAFDENNEEKSVTVKFDSFLVNNHDTGGYYIYWDGKKYTKIFLEG